MKLVNAKWFLDIEIDENMPATLVLESTEAMAEIVEDIYNLCSANDGEFILSEDLKEIHIERAAEIIINPFAIDFNSKKIQNKLYSELISASEYYIEDKALIQAKLVEYIDKLVQDVPYEMITNEIDLDLVRLFKLLDVRLEPQCNTILERLIEYVKVLARLMRKTLLILTNICSYLDDYEIGQLEEICAYHKINMLFIESHEHTFRFPVKTYIIDKDKCLIKE